VSELEKLGITALAWLILAVPAGLVCLALWRLRPGDARRLLPWPRRRPAPWTALDVWTAFLILIFTPLLLAAPLERSGFFTLIYGPQANAEALQERKFLWVGALALPLQVALLLGGLASVRGVRPAQVGLTARRAAQNVVAGYLTWLVLAPVTLLVYWVVTLLVDVQAHPMERLSHLPLLDVEWAAVIFLAVVAAPLTEELVFRGVLLPWQTCRGLDVQLSVGMAALAMAILGGVGKQGSFNPGPMIFVLAMLPGYVILPYLHRRWRERKRGPAAEGRAEGPERNGLPGDSPTPWQESVYRDWQERVYRGLAGFMHLASDKRVNVLLAFYGNGLLFAALHSSVWPSPIPLFMLGFGLAWLAHRTQSLVGPIVAHALFNGVACLDMFLP
jgi:membrane protease YdiL (CAAX protease family)